MAAPGTAYDDDVLGKDPQVGDMVDYVQTSDDNGGVHTNSGIPNRAFYLAATALGGNAWEQAGPIWYAALTSGIGADTDFAGFARATVTAAAAVSDQARTAVEQAWTTVGVLAGAGGAASGGSSGGAASATVAVRRSGGVAGRVLTGQATLGEDPRSTRIVQLLSDVDLRGLAGSTPQPDRFVYAFSVNGEEVTVGEQDLTPELEELAALLIDR